MCVLCSVYLILPQIGKNPGFFMPYLYLIPMAMVTPSELHHDDEKQQWWTIILKKNINDELISRLEILTRTDRPADRQNNLFLLHLAVASHDRNRSRAIDVSSSHLIHCAVRCHVDIWHPCGVLFRTTLILNVNAVEAQTMLFIDFYLRISRSQ